MTQGPPTIFIALFAIVFILIAVMVIIGIAKSVGQWSKDNQQPVLTVPAKVATKRMHISSLPHRDHDRMRHDNTNTVTYHYATFQVASGDRMEFKIVSGEYGLLAEGDEGQLTFQGTRYKGFQRTNAAVEAASAPRSTALVGKELYCPYCGLGVASEFKFCPKCGKALPEFVEEK